MSANNHNPMASSPPSSEGATYHDTPATVVTTYSGSGSSDKDKGKGKAKVKPGALTINPVPINDPFLTAPSAAFGTLRTPTPAFSPLAPEFTPRPEQDAIDAAKARLEQQRVVAGMNGYQGSYGAGMSSHAAPQAQAFSSSTGARQTGPPGIIGQGAPGYGMVNGGNHFNTTQLALPNSPAGLPTTGTFSTDDRTSRSFLIEDVSPKYGADVFYRVFQTGQYSTLLELSTLRISEGKLLVTFGDVSESKRMYCLLFDTMKTWTLTPMTASQVAAFTGKDPRRVSRYQGQLIASVSYTGYPVQEVILAQVHSILDRFGYVKAMRKISVDQPGVVEYRIEFYDSRAADMALNACEARTGNIVVKFEPFTPDVEIVSPAQVSPPSSAGPGQQLSATGRSIVPVDTEYDDFVDHIRRDDGYGGHHKKAPHIAYTRIDIYRIRHGLDVRTTVMLRNIPNRLDLNQLKQIVDQTSAGHYDFMYLRIDFANACNVGYAFINFIDPSYIIHFARARQGRHWNTYNSDKVAEISYATIQGRENLVQKFRNSSVMLEYPAFRPKLYYAGNHLLAGEEEAFPGPNNFQKMRRSMENAETVGLYPTGPYQPLPANTYRPRGLPPASAYPTTSAQPLPPSNYQPQGLPAPSAYPTTSAQPVLHGPSRIPFPTGTTSFAGPTSTTNSALRAVTQVTMRQNAGLSIITPPSSSSSSASPPWFKGDFANPDGPNDVFNRGSNSLSASAQYSRLYAPRQGQANREEQRRRRSQFDRGNPGAEQELAGAFDNLNLGSSSAGPSSTGGYPYNGMHKY